MTQKRQLNFIKTVIPVLFIASACCSPKTLNNGGMTVEETSDNRQVVIRESGKLVLQYNYRTVFEKDVIRTESKRNTKLTFSRAEGIYYDEYLKSHPELTKNDTTTSRIYSVPRSDYIHPLYGLNGEILTNDWPDGGHPHHRGIFWAWPEVEYKTERGDIYALQRVFARPTGNIKYTGGAEFAEIEAENLWMWNDNEPIVRELVTIRAYRSQQDSRIIDLTVNMQALTDGITIATRFTNSYGGLCIRMATPKKQDISYHTDSAGVSPVRSWADLSGIFEGNNSESGMMILQHPDNPEYPGKWVAYPEIAWVHPTSPTPNTRYPLVKETPTIFRYRFIVHQGGKPDAVTFGKRWEDYQSEVN
ncbi:hypothetical protein FACS1894199_16880 [Bacteroidia bacterium]|nr:hypothetical protein FACS1894199_16880 [Bacteroidia bacterium]